MVIAGTALLIALGGTSIAAVNAVLPANSVGTAQLKINAVTGIKVKNRSLGRSTSRSARSRRGRRRGRAGRSGRAVQ